MRGKQYHASHRRGSPKPGFEIKRIFFFFNMSGEEGWQAVKDKNDKRVPFFKADTLLSVTGSQFAFGSRNEEAVCMCLQTVLGTGP